MKKKKMTMIILACSYLLVLALLSTTFAWFFINKEIEVDYDSEITCEAGSSLEISMLTGTDTETGEEIWTEYSGYVKYSGPSAKIEDITGNGKTLYRPTSLINDPITNELTPGGLTSANKTNSEGFGEYVEIEIKLRTTSTMNVYLSGSSFIEPINTSDTDRNAFGDFPKHYICAASRIAILEKDEEGNEELKMIWAPNPNIELTYNSKTGKYILDKNGKIETYSYYKMNEQTGIPEKYTVSTEDYINKSFVIGSTETTESMVAKSPILTTISPSLNQLVEQRMVIRVWFEGTDREANQALGGGQVNLNLKFIGMNEKEEASESDISLIDSIEAKKSDTGYSFNNISENVYYSLNGYEWMQYSSSKLNAINSFINQQVGEAKIYFKCLETEGNYEYIRCLVIPLEGGEDNEG